MQSATRTTIAALALASALLLGAQAQAHQVWIEQDAGHATLVFGEFADHVRETTPGLLDKFGKPQASRLNGNGNGNGNTPLTLEKTAAGFRLSAPAAAGDSIIAQDVHYPVSESMSKGVRTRWAYTPAARYVGALAAHKPSLTLDLVPADDKGSFQVFFKGQPVPRAKVVAIMPAGWSREELSDARGRVQFSLPWRGQYVIEVHHEDRTPGERDGKPYDIGSYVTSLSFDQASGLATLPASRPVTSSAIPQ